MATKDLATLILENRELFSTAPRYFAQDSDGNVNSFSGVPFRFEAKPFFWEGEDKTHVGTFPRLDTWHQEIILYEKKIPKKVKPGPLVHDGANPTAKTPLSIKYPERAFTGLHQDADYAKTYVLKAEDAEKRNIKFDMSFADFAEIVSNKTCCITGVELNYTGDASKKFSLDRLDPTLGYVKGNVVVMSSEVNNYKSELDKFLCCGLSDEHLLKVIYKVEHVLRKRIKKKKEEKAALDQEQTVRESAFKLRYGILPTSKGVK